MKIAIDINGMFVKRGLSQYVKLLIKNLSLLNRQHEYFLYSHFWKNSLTAPIELPPSNNFRFVHHKFPEIVLLLIDFKFNVGIDEIAETIYTIISDKKLRKELSIKGIKKAKEFSWEKTAKETLKIYQTLQ